MINWSIFSDKLRYVDSSMNDTPKLTIRPLQENKHRWLFNALEIQKDQIPEMLFEENKVKESDKVWWEYRLKYDLFRKVLCRAVCVYEH